MAIGRFNAVIRSSKCESCNPSKASEAQIIQNSKSACPHPCRVGRSGSMRPEKIKAAATQAASVYLNLNRSHFDLDRNHQFSGRESPWVSIPGGNTKCSTNHCYKENFQAES